LRCKTADREGFGRYFTRIVLDLSRTGGNSGNGTGFPDWVMAFILPILPESRRQLRMPKHLETQTSLRHKLFLIVGSIVLTVVGVAPFAVWYVRYRELPSVELVDIQEEVNALLLKQRAEGAKPLELFDAQGRPIVARRPLKLELARKLFPQLRKVERNVFDRWSYFRSRGHLDFERKFAEHPRKHWTIVTNSLGFREKTEVRAVKTRLRILVTGDSHTEGVIPTEESFTNVLERKLARRLGAENVEVLNAGKGGYSFFNYPGVLEKHADTLKPDVFVLGVFGGNDFVEAARQIRYFNRLAPRKIDSKLSELIGNLNRSMEGYGPQAINQAVLFTFSPEDAVLGLHAGVALSLEMATFCREKRIRFLVVYIPSFVEAQPVLLGNDIQSALAIVNISQSDLEVLTISGDRYLSALSELDIETIDMRPIFQSEDSLAFWRADHHINTLGHQLIANELAARIE